MEIKGEAGERERETDRGRDRERGKLFGCLGSGLPGWIYRALRTRGRWLLRRCREVFYSLCRFETWRTMICCTTLNDKFLLERGNRK